VFRFNAIVTERSNNLELQRPTVRHENVRHAAGPNSLVPLSIRRGQLLRDKLHKLRFAVWTNPSLEPLKRHSTPINVFDRIRYIVNELLLHSFGVDMVSWYVENCV